MSHLHKTKDEIQEIMWKNIWFDALQTLQPDWLKARLPASTAALSMAPRKPAQTKQLERNK